MNRNLVFLVFGLTVMVGLASVVLIALLKPEALATVINTIVVLLATLSGFAVTAYGLNRVDAKVDQVKSQTNGTLSALIESNRAKDEYIKALLAAAPAHIMEKVER